jgi:hypothetical protein
MMILYYHFSWSMPRSMGTNQLVPVSCLEMRPAEGRSAVETLSIPDAVQHEIAWRLQGGTPYELRVVRGVRWDVSEYSHTPLVAVINRRDPSHTHYFCNREEVEWLLAKLRDAMAEAWPEQAAREL